MKISKIFFLVLGFISLALGAIGIPLPLLPTTPFLLLAAFCFAKASARLDNWFKHTKIYKNHLESFATNREMTLKTKLCILIPATIMLCCAFLGMCAKDTIGTRIGRITIVVLIAMKYLYFFTKIKTVPTSGGSRVPISVAENVMTSEVPSVPTNEKYAGE